MVLPIISCAVYPKMRSRPHSNLHDSLEIFAHDGVVGGFDDCGEVDAGLVGKTQTIEILTFGKGRCE